MQSLLMNGFVPLPELCFLLSLALIIPLNTYCILPNLQNFLPVADKAQNHERRRAV